MTMDLLYRVGGLSGIEIGEMAGVDYSTVSLGRKRLREKLKRDKHLSQIIKRVEADLSTIKILPLYCSFVLALDSFLLQYLEGPHKFTSMK